MKGIFFLIILLYVSLIYCNLVTVSQDSTADYSVIQEAIIACTSYDTILVYPGTYYENIDYLGKELVIGSLNMTTGESEYIHSTIIDGNHEDRVVTVENNEWEGTKIIGFTIQNGYVNTGGGGGVSIDHQAHLDIINCIIENNSANRWGGGVSCASGSSLLLSGTTIRWNFSENKFGGVSISPNCDFAFDPDNLCNIYANYGPDACDMRIKNDLENPEYYTVYLDTFSCLEPDRYFIGAGDDGNNLNWEYLDLNVNTAYYEFYDGDLYVSPNGDDENSGISLDEPMQTIAGAMTRIVSNPENPNTIYLAAGTYSPELNNQLFPLNMKAYVSIIGEDMDTVIWDAQGHQFIVDKYSGFEYELKNMIFINGPPRPGHGIWLYQQNMEALYVNLENLRVLDPIVSSFKILESIEFTMENVIVNGGSGMLLAYNSMPGNHSIVKNCQAVGTGNAIQHANYENAGDRARLDVINCLIADNFCHYEDRAIWSYNISSNGYSETNLVNCTIMNNECDDPYHQLGCVTAAAGGNINIYNSCIYGNTGYEVAIDTWDGGTLGSTVNISHSLIEGGEAGIPMHGDFPSTLNWLEGNLDCDPMLDDNYAPIAYSPLIDAGTTELPYGIVLPETDLAGNPRIAGGAVDIGAFEFNPWGSGTDEGELVIRTGINRVYPNPFNPEVTIEFSTTEYTENTEINIYNIKGQRVSTLVDVVLPVGEHTVIWQGDDDKDKQVGSGVYLVRMKAGDKYVAQRKVTVVK